MPGICRSIANLFLTGALLVSVNASAAISDFYGSWNVSYRGDDIGTCDVTISGATANEARISGTCRSAIDGSTGSGSGTISTAGALSFRGGAADVSFGGSIQGNSGSGSWSSIDGDSGTWTMTRVGGTSTATPGFTLPQGVIPAGNVTVQASGNLTAQTLDIDLKLADLAAASFSAGTYNVYVAALVPGELLGQQSGTSRWFVKAPSEAWEAMGDPIKAFMTNVTGDSQDQRIRVSVLRGINLTSLVGTEIYIGYGTSSAEMIQSRRYRGIFDAQP